MRYYADSHLIDRLVLGLPKSRRLTERILELRHEGWTVQEIADHYGMTRAAVEQRAARARRRSRQACSR